MRPQMKCPRPAVWIFAALLWGLLIAIVVLAITK